jgi:hypothetical protein
MGMNTLRNYPWGRRTWGSLRIGAARRPARPQRSALAATYWRRRFVALMIGMAVLALIAWAFSGALGGGTAAGTGTGSGGGSSQSGAGQRQSGSGQSGSGQGGSGQGGSGQKGSGQGGGGQHGSAVTGTTASPAAGAGPGTHGGRAGQPGACRHGDVVLSLSVSQQSYLAGQLPQFNVDVVATAPQACTFNVGARHVALVIRAGSVRVWSSADCVQGAGDLVSDLARGVPTVLPISWNRRASSPGCPATSAQMPAGTYTAAVSDGSLASNSVTFRIS